jgi:hypothetical protein
MSTWIKARLRVDRKTFLGKQAGLKRRQASTGAVTLIQRFGSAANLNIHA